MIMHQAMHHKLHLYILLILAGNDGNLQMKSDTQGMMKSVRYMTT